MFIELQLDKEGKRIGVNMDQVCTIAESTRTDGYTILLFDDEELGLEVFESYNSVMAKVRARQ